MTDQLPGSPEDQLLFPPKDFGICVPAAVQRKLRTVIPRVRGISSRINLLSFTPDCMGFSPLQRVDLESVKPEPPGSIVRTPPKNHSC